MPGTILAVDCEFVLQFCNENVVWIGLLNAEFIVGREATEADLRTAVQEIKPCHLERQALMVVQNTGNTCTVVGRYLTTNDDAAVYLYLGAESF